MGTLVFMPWAVVSKGGCVGEFELKPVLLDSKTGNDRDWLPATDEMSRILRAYRTPPDIPLRQATLVRFVDREFASDLTEPEIDRLFTLSEAVAFTGLSGRTFFSYGGYSNRDSYLLIAQRFVPKQGGVSIVQRRRHGRLTIGIPEGLWSTRQEPHVERLEHFDLDYGLATVVLGEMDASAEFDRAVRSFNEANTDRSVSSEAQELVSTVSAFQQLFGIRKGKTDDTTEEFVRCLEQIVPAGNPSPEKAKVQERMRRGKSLRAVWMDDLGVLRGNVGHGHAPTVYPSAWTAQEQLLLAAYIFPLLVKLHLAKVGKRPISEDEEDDLAIFDLLLACENLLGAAEAQDGVALSHHWNRVIRDGHREARIRRAVAALK
jgi:hypothetical protein